MRAIFWTTLPLLLACSTPNVVPARQTIAVTSSPTGARATVYPGAKTLVTPAKLELLRLNEYRLDFELEGYAPLSVMLHRHDIESSSDSMLQRFLDREEVHASGARHALRPDPLHVELASLAGTDAPSAREPRPKQPIEITIANDNRHGVGGTPTIMVTIDGAPRCALRREEYFKLLLEHGDYLIGLHRTSSFENFKLRARESPTYLIFRPQAAGIRAYLSHEPPGDFKEDFRQMTACSYR